MAWLIGIDEAGYGPNLGPLVVAASAWWVDEEVRRVGSGWRRQSPAKPAMLAPRGGKAGLDLYRRLAAIVVPAQSTSHLAIADSKLLYKPSTGLRQLERAVLVGLRAVLQSRESQPANWGRVVGPHAPQLPWHQDFDCALPLDAHEDEIDELSERFSTTCGATGVQLGDLRVRMVFPREFNELTAYFGTKGAVLSHVSIALVRDVIANLPADPSGTGCPPSAKDCPLYVTCDKHGGRNRYLALLQHFFPHEWIDTLAESGPVSHYAWGPPTARTEIRFRTQGESELPVALASMTAKYHRELAMRAFNDFWCRLFSDLKPTAGYPLDAKRFRSAIAQRQAELAIADADLWRER